MNEVETTKNGISFQILDWFDFNIEDTYNEDSDDENYKKDDNIKILNKFGLRLFGRTEKNESICCTVTDYTPFFFIKLDNGLSNYYNTVIEKIKERVYPKHNVMGLKSYKIVQKYDFMEFSNFKKFDFLRLDFHNTDSMNSFARALKKKFLLRGKYIKLKAYESNLLPLLRLMHIRKLNAVGWVSIKDYIETDNPKTYSDINIECKWTNLISMDKINNQNFTIMSFDIECVSCDGSFPNPERETDKVIQIGATMSRYGEDECYYKHIITLGSCDPLEGITVESYETEKEVLLAFTKLIQKIDPDIITGYNINGFDFNYLNERAKLLGITAKFGKMSRIKNEISEFVIKDLSSSALGENKLKFFDMKGRVIFDLMKVVQRDYKLPSYKLDEVTSNFIRESIINITNDNKGGTSIIETKNTNGIYLNQYIKICYNDGMTENKHMDGKKFKVIKLEKKSITVEGIIETEEILNRGYKVYWCNAKDDIGPNDIFRMQDEGSLERSIIAKYCIQDCALCNKLIARLQILTNNIGMANVCSVPLQFIFSRGQGIKIFSLVAKKCRDKEHLIQTLKVKPKPDDATTAKVTEVIERSIQNKYQQYEDDEDEEDTGGYEGATVFEPTTGVHYDPIYVLDYSSLYPSSMIMRNLSHEMYVNDPKYLNLKGYIYHEIEYESKIEEKEPEKTVTLTKSDKSDESDESDELMDKVTELNKANMKVKRQMTKKKTRDFSDYKCNLKDSDLDSKNIPNKTKKIKCIFAEKENGEKGIIPEILQELLSARKKFKKQMEKLKDEGGDPFMIAILDGLQLAYKVTANSLYGQTGAPTSPIFKKQIAASTTATGREILQYSKYFNEKVFMKLINHALKGEYDKYKEYFNEFYEYYPHKIDFDEKTLITVCSVDKKKIPESKFKCGSIEYNLLNFNKMYSLYKEYINAFGVNTEKEYEEFCNKINSLPYKEVKNLIELLNDIRLDNDIERKEYPIKIDIKKLQKLNEKNEEEFNKFYNEMYWVLENSGYSSQDELSDKFYNVIRKVLNKKTLELVGIYGDTDSVFIKAFIRDKKTNKLINDKEGLRIGIFLGIWASLLISTSLPPPQKQEYEKVYWPFIILTKKRYVGNLYEKDPEKSYQKSMGIVLKRRDNAPVVKIVCGNIVDQILNKKDSKGAVNITQKLLNKIICGKMPLDKFIITKTLKFSYKDRTKIVHAVLADRMAERDPGNKPESNDRIPYVYFEVEDEKTIQLQGDRVEHPDYLVENKLKIDYLFYITNQIMKPCIQFLELIVEEPEKIFNDYIIREENRKLGKMPIRYYFETDKKSNEDLDIDEFNQILDKNETKPKKKIIKKIVKRLDKIQTKCDKKINEELIFNIDE
jgi:DNA polymerase elongation subunit (family B)